MGIYGALSSAVTGLRAQAHALENISGNIANSQTTGYKRIETEFLDLISDAPISRQVPGAVLAQSRGTNDIGGDIKTVSNETFIALNSNGFFVVEPKIGQSDGNPVFAGTNFFTRRGDFEIDKNGMLVNGAGYYLKGLPVDPGTSNISGSVPEVIRLSNAFLAANVTKSINYQANLPQLPKPISYQASSPNSELIKPWTYANPSPAPVVPNTSGIGLPNSTLQLVPARAFGSVGQTGSANAAALVNDGDRLTVTVGGESYNLWFDSDGVPSSVVNLAFSPTPGWDAVRGATTFSITDAKIADLYDLDNLHIGGVPIPFKSTSHAADRIGLRAAIADALGASITLSPDNGDGKIHLRYNPAGAVADYSASGEGVAVDGYGSSSGSPPGSAETYLVISPQDIAGLHRTGAFEIDGTTIPFAAPLTRDGAGLEAAIKAVFTDAEASYDAVNGLLHIKYREGFRPADASANGVGSSITATGSIDTMLASMQAELRGLSGDNTLFVKLKNGQITVSAGTNDPDPIAFSSARALAGPVSGDILGLGAGPHDPIAGNATTASNAYADLLLNDGDRLEISVAGTQRSYSFDTDGRQTPPAGAVEIDATGSLANILAAIQADLRANGGAAAADAVVTYAGGNVRVEFPGNYYYDATISGSAADKLGIAGVHKANPGRLATVLASDEERFITESISGGAITVYAENGAPANVQLRWAKVDGDAVEGQDTWNLFYLSDSNAQGAETMWTNIGQDYVFRADGSLEPPGVAAVTINNLQINGTLIGPVELRHDLNGVSQFADVNGTVNVSTLSQNGYGAGEFISVAINDNGRVVATYSNGERIDVAQVVTAEFNAINQLKRLDGGVFSSTSESGEAIFDLNGGGIIGGALEASNTDISDEFTKLIITQQAYSAGTRIISAADEMLQEALNMVR